MKLANAIYLTGTLDEDTAQPALEALIESENLGTEADLVIMSPGGPADVGIGLAELIRSLTVKTRALVVGCCDSASVVVAAACDHVVVSPTSTMLLHAITSADMESPTWAQLQAARKGTYTTARRYLEHLIPRLKDPSQTDAIIDIVLGKREEWLLMGQTLVDVGLADVLLEKPVKG